jgi:hypothetical protein
MSNDARTGCAVSSIARPFAPPALAPLQPSHTPSNARSAGSSAATRPPTCRLRPEICDGVRFDTTTSRARACADGRALLSNAGGAIGPVVVRASTSQRKNPRTSRGDASQFAARLGRRVRLRTAIARSCSPSAANMSSSVSSSPIAMIGHPGISSRTRATTVPLWIVRRRTSSISTPSTRSQCGRVSSHSSHASSAARIAASRCSSATSRQWSASDLCSMRAPGNARNSRSPAPSSRSSGTSVRGPRHAPPQVCHAPCSANHHACGTRVHMSSTSRCGRPVTIATCTRVAASSASSSPALASSVASSARAANGSSVPSRSRRRATRSCRIDCNHRASCVTLAACTNVPQAATGFVCVQSTDKS